MEHIQQTPDDLARLLQSTLNFSTTTPSQQFTFTPAPPQEPLRTYASTHYYHPPSSQQTDDLSILRAHSIVPEYLFPSQLHLFSTSPAATRLRLLELWRTAPIRAGDRDGMRYRYGELETTDLLQEEVMTRLRLNRDLAEQRVVASVHVQNGSAGESRAVQNEQGAEPYMVAGYAGSQASSPGLWSVESGESNQAVRMARDFDRLRALHRQVEEMGRDDDMEL